MSGGQELFDLGIGEETVAQASGCRSRRRPPSASRAIPWPRASVRRGNEISATIKNIREPHIEFGGHFLHPDKKTSLAETGPFGLTDPALHPTRIRVGIVRNGRLGRSQLRMTGRCRSPIR